MREHAIHFEGEGRAKQSMRDECDVNLIMARHKVTGLVGHVSATMPEYGDFTNAIEYQDAKNQIIRAEQAFMSLPANVRARMENDPGKFLEFMADPENEDEAIALGLINPKASTPREAEVETPPVSNEPETS